MVKKYNYNNITNIIFRAELS